MKKILVVLAMVMLTASVFAGKIVQVKGSDTMVNLGQAMAEQFMKQTKGAKIALTGGGSGTGIAGLLNQTCDIAQASRSIEQKELDMAKQSGINVKEWLVAYDGIAVVGNNNNVVSNLSSAQIRSIYLGEITNWKEVGGADKKIVVLSRESNSGTHVYFKEHILRKGKSKGPEEYGAQTLFMPSTQAIVDEVAKNDGAIGYIGLGYLDKSIKDIKVDGIEANVANVKNKTYPISRGLFWYTDGEPKGDAKKFLDYAFSKAGQDIIAKEGFVTIK